MIYFQEGDDMNTGDDTAAPAADTPMEETTEEATPEAPAEGAADAPAEEAEASGDAA